MHNYTVNLGPQHPATHGVLRVDLELDGETIIECNPQVGYLHRGFEKLAESKTYAQALILTDRLDYIAAMSNNVGYCVAVERLLSGTGRFNVGLAAVMTMQGVGASLSNVGAGYLVTQGGYGLSHLVGGGVALVAVALFAVFRRRIVPPAPTGGGTPGSRA